MDPLSLSENELTEHLLQFGVEDVAAMNHSEKVSAMFTLMGEDPPTSVSGLTPVSNYTADNASLEGALHDASAVPSEEAEAIASYCSITGSDEDSARHLLEALGWDLDAAVNMHMEQESFNDTGAGVSAPPTSSSFNQPSAGMES
eukprot:CAMPEP_0119034524 /NCGR_PEP_ID=MMETSP1177-20130426/1506_1 /TAXON_ID=2985 /ORGANISM="Ochromonas sp, Strain CCMP1899" /LENGTH=144 /DNA_ID=CAMNT_0006992003 /DNA_START=114 /DNA_END=545 /DNA_ORIENTATION=+